jgi:SOS response regulatory protein OraA/RecX
MLAYKVGISKTLDIEECCKKNVAERPESSDISQQLLPAMKEYDKEFGKQTIWKFLSERGFDRYMIHS